MNSHISASIHKALVGLVHLWVSDRYLADEVLPPSEAYFFVDAWHMQWGDELLRGKRVKVTFEIEDIEPSPER